MSHNPPSPSDVIRAYWRAEEARDVDRVLEFFAPGAEFVDRLGRVVGAEELRAFYVASADAFPGAAVEEERILVDGSFAVAQYVAHLTAADGDEKRARVALIVEFDGTRFRRLESYFDGSTLA
jgi:ketosteroid isomerase-like protein